MTVTVPVSGAIRFTNIGGLSASSGNTQSTPYHLSRFTGIDYGIPTRPSPVRFSAYRGVTNYSSVTTVTESSINWQSGSELYIGYFAAGVPVLNQYPVLSLSALNTGFNIGTRTASGVTLCQIDSPIVLTVNGYSESDLALFMRINNATVTLPAVSETVAVDVTSLAQIKRLVDSVPAGTAIGYIPNNPTVNLLALQNNTNLRSFDLNTPEVLQVVLAQIYQNANNTITNFASFENEDYFNGTVTIKKYTNTVYPCCHLLTRPTDVADVSKTVSFQLNQYPVSVGDTITFYIGQGPNIKPGSREWRNTTVTLTVSSTPKI